VRGIVTIALLGLLLACDGGSRTVPGEIAGIWRSQSPTHADRYLELRDRVVIFGTGRYTMDVRSVERVRSEEAEPPDRGRLHTVSYRSDEGEILDLAVIYEAGPPASLRFVNHTDLWTREQPVPAPGAPGTAGAPGKEKEKS